MQAMGALSVQLAESEKTVRVFECQLQSTILEKNELDDQLQAANVQVYPLTFPVYLPPF